MLGGRAVDISKRVRVRQPAGHGGGQFDGIEGSAVEMITRQSIQTQVQVQQGLVNRPLHLENARVKHPNDFAVGKSCRKQWEGAP